MKLTFWGAAREVTGSMHLLEVEGRRVLLDCGLYHGPPEEARERNREIPFDAASIDAVLLSHAHIDHCGNLPTLVNAGFGGRIHCTSATRDLAALLLLDSAKIQEMEGTEPLYSQEDVARTFERFSTVEYGAPIDVLPGARATFVDAGHMLGSASVAVDIGSGPERRRLLFSGDIGRPGLPILRDPEVPEGADVVIMESTYGDRVHQGAEAARELLAEALASCCREGGMLLVPSFAVGRIQELVYHMNRLWEEGELPAVDVYVDTPLGLRATEVYRIHPECWDAEMRRAYRTEEDRDPLGFDRLTYVRSVQESKELNGLREGAVIIASSGMCEGGRILHHLLHHADDPASTILFVGFQAPGTRGRRILDGAREVEILGRPLEIRARVRKLDAYSAHGDRDGLLAWAERTRERGAPRRLFLVHGEPEAATALADGLGERGFEGIEVPARGETFEV